MNLKSLALVTLLALPGFAVSASNFKKEIVVAPKTKETVVVQTEVPVSFGARFVDMDLSEAIKCGNCLHIETVTQGSKNEAASSFGVGFVRVPPENGRISVNVYHDYDSTKKVEITAEPYKSN